MRKASILSIAFVALVVFAAPVVAEERHQSYFTYEDGGTVVLQSDGRETGVRTNFPLFPGDEIRTSRRGRAEVRLADGNVVALDSSTALRFHSILDSYEGESSQTVAELAYGQVIVHRLVDDSTALRLDTQYGSYVSARDAIYGISNDGRGRDVVSVYEGSVEVRTPSRTTRLRQGEQATLDDQGISGVVRLARDGVSDFERWYLRRAESYSGVSSNYLHHRLAYADRTLSDHGSWVYASDYGTWVWRPYVSSGWRPYYDGRWVHSPGGGLVWVSYEPWGWVPYHYGRWAHSNRFGWVWMPGFGYSHAWVYWAWGPSYVGWIPAGWYDCYGPYYRWAYQPYSHWGYRYTYGFGFYGHVRLRNTQLAGWTFVTPTGLISERVDRAALTTNAIRERLDRDGDRAVISRGARLTRNEIQDPNSAVRAISRRGIGGGTGKEGSGDTTDLTPFFRRDPEVSPEVRSRLTRPQTAAGGGTPADVSGRISRGGGGGVSTPADASTGRIAGRGNGPAAGGETPRAGGTVVPRERVPAAPSTGGSGGTREGAVPRERVQQPREAVPAPSTGESRPVIRERPSAPREQGSSEWRGRTDRPTVERAPVAAPAPRSDESWRGSVVRSRTAEPARTSRPAGERSGSEGSANTPRTVPRTVIDGIGGPRVTPKRESAPPRSVDRPAPSRESSGDSGRVERSRPSGSGGSTRTESPRPSSSSGSTRTESSRPSSSEGSSRVERSAPSRSDSSSSDRGRVKRD